MKLPNEKPAKVVWLSLVLMIIIWAATILIDMKKKPAKAQDVIEAPLPNRGIDAPAGSTPTIYHGPSAVCWDEK
tara:strand:+ start:200 stop:421 length:222 start_codon:yes stop_codon:yes gene_type:complete